MAALASDIVIVRYMEHRADTMEYMMKKMSSIV